MASTEDRKTSYRDGISVGYGAKAATLLLAGVLLCCNTSGYAVDGEDATGLRFIGVCERAVDNSAGSDGDETVHVLTDGCVLLNGSGFDAGDIGHLVYLVDNDTVGKASATDYQIVVGTLYALEGSSQVWVRLQPLAQPKARQLVFQIAGVNNAALDLASIGAIYGGGDLYITAIQHVTAYTTSSGAFSKLLAVTTDYTLADGDITIVTDQSTKTLLIVALGHVVS